jgi:hypothetical protein
MRSSQSRRTHSSVGSAKDFDYLALEVEADRKTTLAQEAPGVDPENVS